MSSDKVIESSHVVSPGIHKEIIEVNWAVSTGTFRSALVLQQAARAKVLNTIFGSIKVEAIKCEVRQDTLVGNEDGQLLPSGHIFVGLVPTSKNTDALTGASASVVCAVPNKQSFPLSSTEQTSRVYTMDLAGYETDIACDPRRGAGLVLWLGNSGIKHIGKTTTPVVSVTWKIWVACSGDTAIW
jgi:hypothetical protein